MSYELNRLMQQYGVSTPALVYGGMSAPVKPEADMLVYRPGTQERIPLEELQAKYDADLASYKADQQAYNDYSTQYRNRLTSTPMYSRSQFGTGALPLDKASSAGYTSATAPEGIGANQYYANIRDWLQQHQSATPAEVSDAQRQWGVSNEDIYRATGNYWGNNVLGLPKYSTPQMPNLTGVLRESAAPAISSIAGQTQAQTNIAPTWNGGGSHGSDNGFSALGDAPDVGTIGGGGYGSDSDGSDGGDSDGGDGYCMGGLVKKYAEGGEVDTSQAGSDPQALPQLTGGSNLSPELVDLIRKDAAAQGIADPVANFVGSSKSTKFGLSPLVPAGILARPASSFPALPTPQPDVPTTRSTAGPLAAMLSRYEQSPSPYAEELHTARARSDKELGAFNEMLAKLAANPESAGPSKAELYFRLAAAFGAPTKTGSFMENAALAGAEMAAHQKETRSAQSEARKQQLQLMLEAQKMRATNAREDLATTRQLAADEAKTRSGFVRDLLREELASGRPQSEAGKAALDAGLQKGTPEFNQFVNDYVKQKLEGGNLFKALSLGIQQQGLDLRKSESAKLTPAEVQLKTETENALSSLDSALQDLNRAYQLNPNTFGNTAIERAQRKLLQETGVKDPKLSNTSEVENLLGSQVMSKLKTTFGGAPTEGERAILMELEGAGSKTPEDRAKIIQRAYKAAKERRAREEKRLNEIKSGLYRSTDSTPGNLE